MSYYNLKHKIIKITQKLFFPPEHRVSNNSNTLLSDVPLVSLCIIGCYSYPKIVNDISIRDMYDHTRWVPQKVMNGFG